MTEIRKTGYSNVSENIEQLQFVIEPNSLSNSTAIPFLCILPKRKENTCTQKEFYLDILRSCIHVSQKLATAQVIITGKWLIKP